MRSPLLQLGLTIQLEMTIFLYPPVDSVPHFIALAKLLTIQLLITTSSQGASTGGDGRQVLYLYAEHNIKQQQDVETDEVEHGSVEMNCQITG